MLNNNNDKTSQQCICIVRTYLGSPAGETVRTHCVAINTPADFLASFDLCMAERLYCNMATRCRYASRLTRIGVVGRRCVGKRGRSWARPPPRDKNKNRNTHGLRYDVIQGAEDLGKDCLTRKSPYFRFGEVANAPVTPKGERCEINPRAGAPRMKSRTVLRNYNAESCSR